LSGVELAEQFRKKKKTPERGPVRAGSRTLNKVGAWALKEEESDATPGGVPFITQEEKKRNGKKKERRAGSVGGR